MSNCIYCGKPARRIRKGEHIIPSAIGGALAIKEVSGRLVCHDCNNGVLSELDRELCCRSFLSIVASQELGTHLWQVWDVDHSARNLLVEARPNWDGNKLMSLFCLPQMTFEVNGPELRGDIQEFEQIGPEAFQKILLAAIRRAYCRYNHREKRSIHLELVRSDTTSEGCRYPPRLFSTHSITEIAQNIDRQSFILRFDSAESLRFAHRALSRLDDSLTFTSWKRKECSRTPTIAHYFDLGLSMRALMKLGINLIAAYCRNTPVTIESFEQAMHLILGRQHPDPDVFAANGFVYAADIGQLQHLGGGHSFRLVYLDREWIVYSSFFGGRIGSVVSFPGPNCESWNTLDIVAPLNSKDWSVTQFSVIQPIKVHVDWSDIAKIAPSVGAHNSRSIVLAERVRSKR